MSSSLARVTFITAKHRIGAVIDGALGACAGALLNSLNFDTAPEQGAPASSCTSNLYSVIVMEDKSPKDALYWWGCVPYQERKRVWHKQQPGAEGDKDKKSDVRPLKVGDLVQKRNGPLYSNGAYAIVVDGGVPKMGQLIADVWTMDEPTARFRVIYDEATLLSET